MGDEDELSWDEARRELARALVRVEAALRADPNRLVSARVTVGAGNNAPILAWAIGVGPTGEAEHWRLRYTTPVGTRLILGLSPAEQAEVVAALPRLLREIEVNAHQLDRRVREALSLLLEIEMQLGGGRDGR